MTTPASPVNPTAANNQSDTFTGIPVQITNQLSVALDIYDVFNPAADGQTAPYLYTKLGTVAAGATGTVTTIRQVAQLEAMYTGTINELQNTYYHQFPIKFMSGTQFSFGTPSPLAYTIVEADRQAAIQSFLFHKFAMANPNSALTTNLNSALKSKDPTAINTFFAATQNFKTCTLSSWNAVMTWLTMFTSGWQGPYYLYETAPRPLPQNYVPILIGTVNIVSTAASNTATLALCSQDSGGNLQPLSPAQGSTVVMAGDGTMTDQNPGQDVTLSLTPVWMNVIQTTMNNGTPTTSYLAGPTLSGTVAGKKVVSTQTLIPLSSQSGSKQKSPAAASSQSFNTLCQVVGLVVGLAMLYEMAGKKSGSKQTAEEKAKADAKSEADFKDKVESIDERAAADNAEIFSDSGDMIARDSRDVADGYAQASEIQQKDVLTQTIESEAQTLTDEINAQERDGSTPTDHFETAFENTTDSFKTAQQQIEAGNLKEASTTMSDAATSMQNTIDQKELKLSEWESDALKNSSEAVDSAAKEADALNDAKEEYEQKMDNEQEDSGFNNEDGPPETEAIPEEL